MAGDTPANIGDYFDVLRRRWIYMATVIPAAVLVAVYVAFTLPPIYRSSATILLEASSIPQELIRTTVTDYADQQLEIVSRRVLTADNLVPIVEGVDPYPDRPDLDVRDKAALIAQNTQTERVDPVTLEALPQSNALSIHYLNPDPTIAQEVAGLLADRFTSYNRETRTLQATETYGFLQVQAEQAREKILEVEQELADFKTQYGDAIPEAQDRNQQSLDRTERELEMLEQQILLANDRKRLLEVQLSALNPNLFDPAGNWRTELATLRTELAVARQKYTPVHPEVRRLERAIEALSVRVAEAGPAEVAPDNPEYIQIASQLETVDSELAARQASAARARQQIADYEHALSIAPEVEREYRQLEREYDVARERYRGIQESLAEAALGQDLESEARGDRLSVIQQPRWPSSPYSPNRLGIILMGIVLGGALGGALAAFAESADPTIRSARDLAEITDIKPLAAVPVIMNGADRRKRLFAWTTASIVAAIAIMFVGTAISQAAS